MSGFDIITSPDQVYLQQYLEQLANNETLRRTTIRSNYILIDPDPDRNYYQVTGPDGKIINIEIALDANSREGRYEETQHKIHRLKMMYERLRPHETFERRRITKEIDYLESKTNAVMAKGSFYNKEQNSISGRVVGVPKHIDKRCNCLVEDFQLGDRVIFHFNCLEMARESNYVIEDETGYEYLAIMAELIYCTVRQGEIMPVGNNVLVKPIDETEADLRTRTGIITKAQKGKKAQEGIVAVVGHNMGRQVLIEKGDNVLFSKDDDIPLRVEGQTYWRMKHEDILAKKLPKAQKKSTKKNTFQVIQAPFDR
jgi:co-chaperonin GroES (HSP10)